MVKPKKGIDSTPKMGRTRPKSQDEAVSKGTIVEKPSKTEKEVLPSVVPELCLIRHGETVFNLEDRLQGDKEIELTPRGLEDAARLGHLLRKKGVRPREIFSSPVKRALDTAVALGMDVPVVANPAFAARGLGKLEGRTKTEVRSLFPGAIENLLQWDWVPPGATESLGAMFRRADSAVETLTGDESKNTVVVTHSGVLEALLRGWYSLGPADRLPVVLKNTCALFFGRRSGKWEYRFQISVGTCENVDHA